MKTSPGILFGGMLVILTVLSAASASASQTQRWRFQVFLDDKAIGYHEFRLTPRGKGSYQLESDARFDVKFLFITAYRYRHNNTELWQDRCLERIDARTNANGERYIVTGRRKAGIFEIDNHSAPVTAAGCVKTFAYWDPSILEAERLLNAQTGEFVDIIVASLGEEAVRVGDKQVLAKRYRLVGEAVEIDLWYAADGNRWVGLQSTTESGRKLSYLID
jgi:hypothetical protein